MSGTNDNNTPSKFTIHSYFSDDNDDYEEDGEIRSLTVSLTGTKNVDVWLEEIGDIVSEMENTGFGTFDVASDFKDFDAHYDFADNTYKTLAEHDKNQDEAFKKACELLEKNGFTVVSTEEKREIDG